MNDLAFMKIREAFGCACELEAQNPVLDIIRQHFFSIIGYRGVPLNKTLIRYRHTARWSNDLMYINVGTVAANYNRFWVV